MYIFIARWPFRQFCSKVFFPIAQTSGNPDPRAPISAVVFDLQFYLSIYIIDSEYVINATLVENWI